MTEQSLGKPPKRTAFSLLLAVIILAGGIRFYELGMDPPESMGLHFISDEGWWVHNARNKVLFDEWILDEFNQSLLVSPTFCVSTWWVYRYWGVSVVTSRIVPAVSGLLAVILLMMTLKYYVGFRERIFAGLLLGLNFGFTFTNRVAYVDSTAFLFVLLCWWLLESCSHRIWGVYLAGAAAALAVATKSYVLTLVPVFFVIYAIRSIKYRTPMHRHLSHGTLFFLGVFTVFLFWHRLIYLPFEDQFRIMYYLWSDGNIPSGLDQMIKNIPALVFDRTIQGISLKRFFQFNIVLIMLTWWRIGMILPTGRFRLRQWFTRLDKADIEGMIWLILSFLLIAPLTAKPFRRYLFCYLPLILLACQVTRNKVETSTVPSSILIWVRRFWFYVIPPCILGPYSLYILSILFGRPMVSIRMTALATAACAVVIILAGFKTHVISRQLKPISIPLVLLLILVLDALPVIHSFWNRSYSLRDTSRELAGTFFTPGTVVLGGIADSLCLEGKAKALAIWGRQEAPRVLNENPLRFHPDYILLPVSLDGIPFGFEARYYSLLSDENFIKNIDVLPTRRGIYRVTAALYKAPRK